MRLFNLVLLLVLLVSNGRLTENVQKQNDPMMLFDFNDDDQTTWQVVNDGVMGGRSQGYVEIKEGILRFSGELVTQGGGFTSVRVEKTFNLEGYDGLELRIRGGGRTFEVEANDLTRAEGRSVSRRAPFKTQTDWAVVRVPFSAFRTTVFGRRVSAPPLDLEHVRRFGLYILDGKDGPFHMEVDTISAYRLTAE